MDMISEKAEYRASAIFLLLYMAASAVGVYGAYRAGLFVEARYGSQVSLIFFLVGFFVALTVAYPISVAVASRGLRT